MRKNYEHYCGGSIISKNFVLTAAHCVANERPNDITVLSGTVFRNRPNHGKIHSVKNIIVHEHFAEANAEALNDVALLEVYKPFKFSKQRNRVVMFEAGEKIHEDSEALISGWGTTEFNGELSPILLQVEVAVIKKEECDKAYGRSEIRPREDAFCAGLYQMCGERTCPGGQMSGDSGGPVTIGGRLAGIVSWSDKRSNLPGVHAEVGYHRKWIDKNTKFDTIFDEESNNCGITSCFPKF